MERINEEPQKERGYCVKEVAELEKRFDELVSGKVKGRGSKASIHLIRKAGKTQAKRMLVVG